MFAHAAVGYRSLPKTSAGRWPTDRCASTRAVFRVYVVPAAVGIYHRRQTAPVVPIASHRVPGRGRGGAAVWFFMAIGPASNSGTSASAAIVAGSGRSLRIPWPGDLRRGKTRRVVLLGRSTGVTVIQRIRKMMARRSSGVPSICVREFAESPRHVRQPSKYGRRRRGGSRTRAPSSS